MKAIIKLAATFSLALLVSNERGSCAIPPPATTPYTRGFLRTTNATEAATYIGVGVGSVTGSGTLGNVPYWTGASALGDSLMSTNANGMTLNGTLLLGDGSISNPAIGFSAQKSGLYRGSDHTINFEINGTTDVATLGDGTLGSFDGLTVSRVKATNALTVGTISLTDNSGSPTFSGTGALNVPSGTTAQQPSSPVNGMIRYNSTIGRTELYSGGAWRNYTRLDGDLMTGPLTNTASVLTAPIISGGSLSGVTTNSSIFSGPFTNTGTMGVSGAVTMNTNLSVGGLGSFGGSTLSTFTLSSAASGTLEFSALSTGAYSSSSGAGITGVNAGTPSAANQRLGFYVLGSNPFGTTVRNAVGIAGWSEAAWTDGTSHPSYLTLETTASGSATRTERWRVTATGHLIAGADNSYDIGASAATRPRNLYIAGTSTFSGAVTAPSLTATNSITTGNLTVNSNATFALTPTVNGASVLTNVPITSTVTTLTWSTTNLAGMDLAASRAFKVTLTNNAFLASSTFANLPTTAQYGEWTLLVLQDSVGGWTINATNTVVRSAGGVFPGTLITTNASTISVLTFCTSVFTNSQLLAGYPVTGIQ